MSYSLKKQLGQAARGKLSATQIQHLKLIGVSISLKSLKLSPLRRFAAWWETTLVEKLLEDLAYLLKNAALLDIINLAASITIILSLISWWTGRQERWENEIFATWQIVEQADGDKSGVAKLAIELLLRNNFSLAGLDLSETSLQDADLAGANLRKANLRKSVLWRANLRDADLRWVNLKEAYLVGADLRGAQLNDADLYKANLKQTILSPTDIPQVKQARNFETAIYDAATRKALGL